MENISALEKLQWCQGEIVPNLLHQASGGESYFSAI